MANRTRYNAVALIFIDDQNRVGLWNNTVPFAPKPIKVQDMILQYCTQAEARHIFHKSVTGVDTEIWDFYVVKSDAKPDTWWDFNTSIDLDETTQEVLRRWKQYCPPWEGTKDYSSVVV